MNPDIAQKVHNEFTKYPYRTYPKGQILVFADENPEHIFYLISGRVRKYDVSYHGDEVVVNVFKPPAFFPMSWAIDKIPNKFFYKTETETELHIVPTEAALEFVKSNPDVMLDLLTRIYRGSEGLLERMVYLMSGTAQARLLYEIYIECQRFGQKQQNGTYLVPTNEVEFAARSGLSRETISREMQKIKEKGLVKVTNSGIIVENIDKLEKALHQEN